MRKLELICFRGGLAKKGIFYILPTLKYINHGASNKPDVEFSDRCLLFWFCDVYVELRWRIYDKQYSK